MTDLRIITCAVTCLLGFCSPGAAQQESTLGAAQQESTTGTAQNQSTTDQSPTLVMTTDFSSKPFPGGLRFSADGSMIWTNQLEAWNVRNGERVDTPQFKGFRQSRRIIDIADREQPLLIAAPKSRELIFWDANKGLRRRVLEQPGKLVAARYIDQGKRFALAFSKPSSVYVGSVDSDASDSTEGFPTEIYKCVISPNGKKIAVLNENDIEVWDLDEGSLHFKLPHDHEPFSFAFSHDSQWIATGTSFENMVRVFDMSEGKLAFELKGHTEGTIFLRTAVYSLAFAPNGKWLASGGHDGRVIVWDLERREPRWRAEIPDTPIVCSVTFSPDSKLVAGSIEGVGPKRGIRVWSVLNSD